MKSLRGATVALVLLLTPANVAEAAGEGGEEAPSGLAGCAHVWGETDFVAKVVNFGLFAAILFLLARRPVGNYLKERRVAIEENLAEAKRLKEEAQKRYDEYSERLQKLDEELERIRSEMIQAGEAERDRIVADAEQKASRMRRETEFVIEQRMKQLRADLVRESVDAAIDAAEQVLREKTTSADQQRLAEQYLAKLNEVAGRGREPSDSARAPHGPGTSGSREEDRP